jgi:hypothetical protein
MLDDSVDLEAPPPPPEPERAPPPEPIAPPTHAAIPSPPVRVPTDKPMHATTPDENPLAQAARTLTTDDPDPAADEMVQGNADTFSGGVSGADGVNGYGAGGRGGGAAPPPPPPPPPEPDHSRRASCSLQVDWGCEYPSGAVGEALVQIRLEVGVSGEILHAAIVADQGPKFRSEALACAFKQHCDAPRNREGKPITGWTKPITIRFMPH